MANSIQNNLKLGIFVSVGLVILIFSLYMIGRNRGLFVKSFELRTRFSNTSGLRKGNNVLYAGIQVGTVKKITLFNDTTVEVSLLIDNKLKKFINKNALVSISTEGLMGNKVVQIQPNGLGQPVARGDLLKSKQGTNIDEMLQVLSRTNQNIEGISEVLKVTVMDIKQSSVLALLKDKTTADRLKMSVVHIDKATENVEQLSYNLVKGVKNKNTTIGILLGDTLFGKTLKNAATDIGYASNNANKTVLKLNQIVEKIDSETNNNTGLLYLMLKDTVLAKKLNTSLDNVQMGTAGFNQNMEALKNNFLFRGYFRKIEREKLKSKDNK